MRAAGALHVLLRVSPRRESHQLREEEEREAQRVDVDADLVEEGARAEGEEIFALEGEGEVGDAVDEQQDERDDQREEAEGGDRHQQRGVLQQTEDDRQHRQNALHDVALQLGVVRHDRETRQKVRHHDLRVI